MTGSPPPTNPSLYRLYIDEVGNHDMRPDLPPGERFLSLFGVWTSLGHVSDVIQPEMAAIKAEFFKADPDVPIVFHRKEIARFQGPFAVLYADPDLRRRFGDRMLRAYSEWDYTSAVVTIDKVEHLSRYQVWRHAPYHYCLEVLLERYVLYLHYRGLRGDVMIEARNPGLDTKLADSFNRLYREGSRHLPAETFRARLTSSQLKLKNKAANIAGLQLADLLAHPAHYDCLAQFGMLAEQESEYGKEVARILNAAKFNRDQQSGKVVGFGKKLLP
jgi:hypothetical protein